MSKKMDDLERQLEAARNLSALTIAAMRSAHRQEGEEASMKFFVDAYVAAPAGGNILKTLEVEADDVTFKDGTALFTRKATERRNDRGYPEDVPCTVFVRAFAPEIWTQVRPEPDIARKPVSGRKCVSAKLVFDDGTVELAEGEAALVVDGVLRQQAIDRSGHSGWTTTRPLRKTTKVRGSAHWYGDCITKCDRDGLRGTGIVGICDCVPEEIRIGPGSPICDFVVEVEATMGRDGR